MRILKAFLIGLKELKKEDAEKAAAKQKTEAHEARFAEYLRLVDDPISYSTLDSIVNHARRGVKIVLFHKDGHRFEFMPVDQFDIERTRRPIQSRPDF